jgi:hypothetical protein
MRALSICALVLASACGGPPRPAPAPPPPAPPPPPPAPVFAPAEVWTRDAGAVIQGAGFTATVPLVFTRLEVLRVDSARLLVRCPRCPGQPIGHIDTARVAHTPTTPELAARMDLADFVLAVRDAARRRDIPALRSAMSRDFIHSLEGGEGVLEAVAAWQLRNHADVDRLPALLDRGVANVLGTAVWAAPPEYAQNLSFLDLRAGFRRGADGWEWIFLVRSGLR